MKLISFSDQKFISIIRFLAHLFSVLLIFTVILLTFGETFPSSSNFSTREILFTFTLLIILFGLFAAWKWEGIGGTVILLGYILFLIINSVFSDFLNLGFYFLLFPLTGILYLFCCFGEKNTKEI